MHTDRFPRRCALGKAGDALVLALWEREMRYQGKSDSWKNDSGFGFITQKPEGYQIFVHISSFLNRQRRPVGNEIVSYELKVDARGRPQAVRVAFSDEVVPIVFPASRTKAALIFAAAFVLFVAGAALIGRLPLIVLGAYLAASAIAFISVLLGVGS